MDKASVAETGMMPVDVVGDLRVVEGAFRWLLPVDGRRALMDRAVQIGSVGNGNDRAIHLDEFWEGKRVGFRVTVRGGNHGARVFGQW